MLLNIVETLLFCWFTKLIFTMRTTFKCLKELLKCLLEINQKMLKSKSEECA